MKPYNYFCKYKIQHKNAKKLGTEGACLDIIKTNENKETNNSILYGEKLKAFCTKSDTSQVCALQVHPFNSTYYCNPNLNS